MSRSFSLLLQDGKGRRSPGGVFLHLLKSDKGKLASMTSDLNGLTPPTFYMNFDLHQ